MRTDEIKQIVESLKNTTRDFIPSTRQNNRDGGFGNTLEDILGVQENNLQQADWRGIELKTHRIHTSSVVSLFSKSPSHPKRANRALKDQFGEIRDGEPRLYASLRGDYGALVYGKHQMRLVSNDAEERLYLQITSNGNTYNDVYWTYSDLRKASNKIKDLLLLDVEEKTINGKRMCRYIKGHYCTNFDFERLIRCIDNGVIQFDLRMGTYLSGAKKGKHHDHGSGFRIALDKLPLLYDNVEEF